MFGCHEKGDLCSPRTHAIAAINYDREAEGLEQAAARQDKLTALLEFARGGGDPHCVLCGGRGTLVGNGAAETGGHNVDNSGTMSARAIARFA